jgi:hypothetical protein
MRVAWSSNDGYPSERERERERERYYKKSYLVLSSLQQTAIDIYIILFIPEFKTTRNLGYFNVNHF